MGCQRVRLVLVEERDPCTENWGPSAVRNGGVGFKQPRVPHVASCTVVQHQAPMIAHW